jgi:predicted neuraminidase
LESHKTGEYSYPAIIQDTQNRIHVTYTFDRKNIKHIMFNIL